MAEIGNNHEGNIERAGKMVREAAACGADAVKFQTYRTELFVNSRDQERYDRMKRFELTFEQFSQLAKLARECNVAFLSTPLDLASADFLADFVDAFKIASGDNQFYPLMARVASSGKPLVISAGLSSWEDLDKSVAFVRQVWSARSMTGELALLHCVSAYPASETELNLRVIAGIRERFGVTAGYSDHSLGIDACCIAVAAGAKIIEKHFTLDKNLSSFRDHQLSADPAEMKSLVARIRNIEIALGRENKVVTSAEQSNLPALRRSIVAAANLPVGHEIRGEDLSWLRPGGGVPPGQEDTLIGRSLVRAVSRGEMIRDADLRPRA